MNKRLTGTGAGRPYETMRAALRQLWVAFALAVSLLPCAASAGNKDLVIVHSERWIDTIKATVKNVSPDRADEVVIVVRFYGDAVTSAQPPRRKPARSHEMGQQSVKLMALDPGQEAPFEVEIAEKHRKATSFKFEAHAIWRKGTGGRPNKR